MAARLPPLSSVERDLTTAVNGAVATPTAFACRVPIVTRGELEHAGLLGIGEDALMTLVWCSGLNSAISPLFRQVSAPSNAFATRQTLSVLAIGDATGTRGQAWHRTMCYRTVETMADSVNVDLELEIFDVHSSVGHSSNVVPVSDAD